jgi:hypothetical protein
VWRREHQRAQNGGQLAPRVATAAFIAHPKIVYVQPNASGPDIISFRELTELVSRHRDPVSQQFAASLLRWAEVRAGSQA